MNKDSLLSMFEWQINTYFFVSLATDVVIPVLLPLFIPLTTYYACCFWFWVEWTSRDNLANYDSSHCTLVYFLSNENSQFSKFFQLTFLVVTSLFLELQKIFSIIYINSLHSHFSPFILLWLNFLYLFNVCSSQLTLSVHAWEGC